MESPNLRKLLDISTSHLKKEDLEALSAVAGETNGIPFRAYEDEYGFYVAVGCMNVDPGNAGDRLAAAGLSKEFVALMEHARDLEVQVIRFEAEAELEPGFPVFDHMTGNEIDPADLGAELPKP